MISQVWKLPINRRWMLQKKAMVWRSNGTLRRSTNCIQPHLDQGSNIMMNRVCWMGKTFALTNNPDEGPVDMMMMVESATQTRRRTTVHHYTTMSKEHQESTVVLQHNNIQEDSLLSNKRMIDAATVAIAKHCTHRQIHSECHQNSHVE